MESRQAFVDPEAIDEMARAMLNLGLRVKDFDSRLESQLAALGATYGDASYDEFVAEFQAARKHIRDFVEGSKTAFGSLRDDSERIRTFLARRAAGGGL